MSDLATLIEMGFSQDRAKYAIKVTNNKGVEPAMEWLLAHEDDEIPRLELDLLNDSEDEKDKQGSYMNKSLDEAAMPELEDDSEQEEAAELKGKINELKVTKISKEEKENAAKKEDAANNSLITAFVCDDCKKICQSEVKMEYHFMKTGHFNFSEVAGAKKQLTEEDRKKQLALIEERLKQKRIEREEREKIDAVERERNRIRCGKDLTEARKRLEEIEMQKIVEQRKREKAEEKTARERVRAQIELDKARRRSTQSNGTAENNSDVQPSTTSQTVQIGSKHYTKTKIQIRLQDGSTITEVFSVKEQLSAVRLFIQIKTNNTEAFGLMTTFPRKVFTDDDYDKPLDVLGLVPSVVLYMTKPEA